MASIFDNATAVPTKGDVPPIVRDVYNAIQNEEGVTHVALLARDADDEYAAGIADTDEVIEGTTLVLRSGEYTAEDLRGKVNQRNTDNKRHAKLTLGAVAVSNYLNNEKGERVGIVVSGI